MNVASRATFAASRLLNRGPQNASARLFASKANPIIIAMPKLSPRMTEGRIFSWLKKEGDEISADELYLEVSTAELVEEENKDGSETTTLVLEAQDPGFIARILPVAIAGATVRVGTPLAVMCEEEEDIESLLNYEPPVDNVYDYAAMETHGLQAMTWQAYLQRNTSPATVAACGGRLDGSGRD